MNIYTNDMAFIVCFHQDCFYLYWLLVFLGFDGSYALSHNFQAK